MLNRAAKAMDLMQSRYQNMSRITPKSVADTGRKRHRLGARPGPGMGASGHREAKASSKSFAAAPWRPSVAPMLRSKARKRHATGSNVSTKRSSRPSTNGRCCDRRRRRTVGLRLAAFEVTFRQRPDGQSSPDVTFRKPAVGPLGLPQSVAGHRLNGSDPSAMMAARNPRPHRVHSQDRSGDP